MFKLLTTLNRTSSQWTQQSSRHRPDWGAVLWYRWYRSSCGSGRLHRGRTGSFCLCTSLHGGAPQREWTCRGRVHLTACGTPEPGPAGPSRTRRAGALWGAARHSCQNVREEEGKPTCCYPCLVCVGVSAVFRPPAQTCPGSRRGRHGYGRRAGDQSLSCSLAPHLPGSSCPIKVPLLPPELPHGERVSVSCTYVHK